MLNFIEDPKIAHPPEPKAKMATFECVCGKEIETDEPWDLTYCDYTEAIVCNDCRVSVQYDFYATNPDIFATGVTSKAFRDMGLANKGIEKDALIKKFREEYTGLPKKSCIEC